MPTLPLLRSTMSLTHLPRLRSCVFPTLVRFPILLHPVAAASLDATEVSPLRVLRFKDLPPSRIHNLVEFRSAILSINSRTYPGPTRCSKRYVLPESVLTSRRHTLRSLLRFRSQPMLGVTLGFRRPHPLWSLIGTTQSTGLPVSRPHFLHPTCSLDRLGIAFYLGKVVGMFLLPLQTLQHLPPLTVLSEAT